MKNPEISKFEDNLNSILSNILEKRPNDPYKELIYQLLADLPEDLLSKNPNMEAFFKSHVSEI